MSSVEKSALGAEETQRIAQSSHTSLTHAASNSDLEKGATSDADREELAADQIENRNVAGKDDDSAFLVTFEGREKLNPHTWRADYRWFLTGFNGVLIFNSTLASAGPSGIIPSIEDHYGVSMLVGTALISIFVAGYCVGPLLWGPLSERYGRRNIFIISFVLYTAASVGCALSPNIGALLTFRFLAGSFAASSLTNCGAMIADMWDVDRRGIAICIFSLAPFAGPALAPVISGALQVTGSNFRWLFWILSIFAGVCTLVIVVIVPETNAPYILQVAAKELRRTTNEERYHSTLDLKQRSETWRMILDRTILKPFIMIAQEPMLLALTIYMSFVYGIIYLLFESIPIIGSRQHGMNELQTGLIFLSIPIGSFFAVLLYIHYFNKRYVQRHKAPSPKAVPPEERLLPIMLGAPIFAASFFWIGWTAYPSISIWSVVIGLGVMSFSIIYVFVGVNNYLVDAYLANAASALAILTVVRSIFGAGFPLFATQMFERLGVPAASSLLGGIAIAFIPIPFVLHRYGKKIRSLSKNAVVRPDE